MWLQPEVGKVAADRSLLDFHFIQLEPCDPGDLLSFFSYPCLRQCPALTRLW